MRKLNLALAGAAASVVTAAPAQAALVLNFDPTSTAAIAANNDFRSLLAGLGLSRYATTGASLVLDLPAEISFHFLGSESWFSDTFSTPGGTPIVTRTETSTSEKHFASPIFIGSSLFASGTLAGSLLFSSVGGLAATVGQDGFAIFLDPNQVSGQPITSFYMGYDEQIVGPDDDHDDFIVRATVGGIPEPSTWAMMLGGFAAVGYSLRRRRSIAARLPQLA